MTVTRIVSNLPAKDPKGLAEFYKEVFGLEISGDMGWITFLAASISNPTSTASGPGGGGGGAPAKQKIEMHTASEGGNGTPLPVISIGVSDIDATLSAVRAKGVEVVYGPKQEDWGLRRFFFRDPEGNLINVVDH